jgi:hypothetical protein
MCSCRCAGSWPLRWSLTVFLTTVPPLRSWGYMSLHCREQALPLAAAAFSPPCSCSTGAMQQEDGGGVGIVTNDI